MASREDRVQSRLRGAQRREIKEVDFGLTFPALPADADPSIEPPQNELPQSELPPQRSTRRTPARPPPSAPVVTQDITRVSQSTNDANTSAKRRKLDTDIPPTSSRSTRSQNPPRRDVYAIETEHNAEPEQEQDSSILEPAAALIEQDAGGDDQLDGPPDPSLLDVTEHSVELEAANILEPEQPSTIASPTRPARMPLASQTFDEVTESPKNAPGSGRRQRVVVGATLQTSSQLAQIQNADSDARTATPLTRRKRKRGETSVSPQIRESQEPSAIDEIDELSPEQPIRRGRKPKIIQVPLPEQENIEDVEEGEAGAIDDEEAAAVLKKYRGRRTSKRFAAASPDLDTLNTSSLLKVGRSRKRHRAESSPVQQRNPKKAAPKPQAPQKTAKKSGKKQHAVGGSVPVTIHRLTLPPLYDETETDADILNAEMPHMKRSGVSAIDVLSSICQEIIGIQLSSLEQMGNSCEDSASRREYKTKWNAVEAFGKELQLRLLTQAINLDSAYSLERRVRDQLRKKNSLREEVLQVRKEREQVALRMDEIRMKHEREKTDAQSRDTLNTAVHDIEMAIEMGKSNQTSTEIDHSNDLIGTELLIKRVAGEVSNKGDSGGILKQIKEFNAFLERAALALEAKKV
ncbi:hypothetical protein DL98DRAFT_587590 [Cadophora sp. DSE1049]|nr:hypothetical protein DL98DRAFT_587590 [Cadophora sp. DSE1049]